MRATKAPSFEYTRVTPEDSSASTKYVSMVSALPHPVTEPFCFRAAKAALEPVTSRTSPDSSCATYEESPPPLGAESMDEVAPQYTSPPCGVMAEMSLAHRHDEEPKCRPTNDCEIS